MQLEGHVSQKGDGNEEEKIFNSSENGDGTGNQSAPTDCDVPDVSTEDDEASRRSISIRAATGNSVCNNEESMCGSQERCVINDDN